MTEFARRLLLETCSISLYSQTRYTIFSVLPVVCYSPQNGLWLYRDVLELCIYHGFKHFRACFNNNCFQDRMTHLDMGASMKLSLMGKVYMQVSVKLESLINKEKAYI